MLDRRTLNRSLLARQFLLERVDAPVADVVEHLVGMQAQVPLDPYVALWSRIRAFDPAELGQLMLDREAVRMTLMRTTLHLVSARDALRIRPLVQGMVERAFASSSFARDLVDLDLAPLLARGVELVELKPRTTRELATALAEEWPNHDANALAHAIRFLVPLVQVTPRGVWGEALQPTMTTLSSWLGRAAAPTMSVEELVLRYLGAFGPATVADLRAWSWLTNMRPIIDRLRPQLCSYRDEAGRELYDVRDGVFGDPSAPAPTRFLPQYDNVFLAHADRSRIMDHVKWGNSFNHQGTIFVDGFLTGAWRLRTKSRDATLTLELRAPVSRLQHNEITTEAGRLLDLLTPETRSRRLDVLRT